MGSASSKRVRIETRSNSENPIDTNNTFNSKMKVFNLSFLFAGVLGQDEHTDSWWCCADEAMCVIWSGGLWCSTSLLTDGSMWSKPNWFKIDTTLSGFMGIRADFPLADISCNSSNDCWAVTQQSGILYYFGNIKDASFPLSDYRILRPESFLSFPFKVGLFGVMTRSVSVADDGTVWGITTNDEIYKGRNGAAFEYVGVGLDVAAISYNEALVVGPYGQLYHLNNGNWALNSRLGADRLKKVSRCANNEIWAIRNDGAIWRVFNDDVTDRLAWGVDTSQYWETRDCDPPELPDDVTDIICKDNKVYHVKGSKDLYQRILINQGGWEMTHTLKYWYKVPRSEVNSLG